MNVHYTVTLSYSSKKKAFHVKYARNKTQPKAFLKHDFSEYNITSTKASQKIVDHELVSQGKHILELPFFSILFTINHQNKKITFLQTDGGKKKAPQDMVRQALFFLQKFKTSKITLDLLYSNTVLWEKRNRVRML